MTTSFLHVDFQQPAEMRFNRARVRRAFVTIGQRHMRDARRLVMRRARSAPGENPGQRSKLTNQLVQTVRGYIRECLQWMIDDGVVSRIDLDIRRTGINELGNSITLWRRDGPVMISFDDLWSAITHGGQ